MNVLRQYGWFRTGQPRTKTLFCIAGVAFSAALAVVPKTFAAEILPGPFAADVVRVVDGDTLDVSARVWLGQTVQVRVRLDGVDTPELRGRCAGERARAEQALNWLADQVAGRSIALRQVRFGKYAGRIVARVELDDGQDLSVMLLQAGLARPYRGGKRVDWCG